MDDKDFLGKRKDRALASILSFKDREVDQFIPEDVSYRLRKLILDEFNGLYESAVVVIDGNVNDYFLERLSELLDEKL